ncbi:hypothetical protein ALP24_101847 [Pseudomonas syringae pv. aptata]|uniref:Uncharacterized protein n=1 Tax=Pseudomonas syringae pv. aptata TaxID=83167 RepID=A0A3M5XCC0_PSEAP|nr:hypothetical protein ALP24_101847 [Pseudomonas syringae pv. aptata]
MNLGVRFGHGCQDPVDSGVGSECSAALLLKETARYRAQILLDCGSLGASSADEDACLFSFARNFVTERVKFLSRIKRL